MSQPNPKYKRLEALLSESRPVAPDPTPSPLPGELDELKGKVASLQAELAAQQIDQKRESVDVRPTAMVHQTEPRALSTVPDHIPQDPAARANIAFLIALLLSVGHFAAAAYYEYLGFSSNTLQFHLLASISFSLGVLIGIGSILSRRGRPTLGIILGLGAIAVSYPPLPLLAAGLGLVLGPALLIAGPMIAFQTLPPKSSRAMTAITFASGLATLLLDLFGSTTRPPLPGFFIPMLAATVVCIIGYFLLRQFRNYSLRTKLLLGFLGILLLAGLVTAYAIREQFQAAEQAAITESRHVAETLGVAVAREQADLQDLVQKFHLTQQREVRVLNADQRILASAIPENIGRIYDSDQNDEVSATLNDGQPRAFLETSADYPQGIKLVVVPVEDEQTGTIIGVILLDYTQTLRDSSLAAAQGFTDEVAATIANNPGSLHDFIDTIFTARNQDMVVIDLQREILADARPENAGEIYARDVGGEVAATLQDGRPRVFTEISVDHPRGIQQIVTALKTADGQIFGATILATSPETERTAIIQATELGRSIGVAVAQSQSRLQGLVVQTAETQNRDVEVVDTNLRITADVNAADIGTIFDVDQNGEVAATLSDGQPRTFVEISEDYPQGVRQTVVPVRDGTGKVVSAVVMDYSQLYNEIQRSATVASRSLIIIGLICLLLALVVSRYISVSITNPISSLSDAAIKIGSGELNTPIPGLSGKDEVGILANAFNSMLFQLRDLFGNLEKRVQDRTYDLELATEVGRTVTGKVSNLQAMLSEATEMMRSRFELDYTQVYLLDPSGQTITLRAGTGQVGHQLLERGHQLQVNSGSLNGRAVLEKKSIIVADTAKSGTFLANPLLPDTRSEMVMPLMVGGHVLGVLDMQSNVPDALNQSNLPAFETLAGQLSIAIQNATLFAQSEDARKEVEANIRNTTESGWQDFLNGIQRGERIGYTFDQVEVVPMETAHGTNSANALNVPIKVTGANIGAIRLVEGERQWTAQEAEIVQAAAGQLAQHLDNMRLLEQAESYRSAAEQAVRRLTREGWEAFVQTRSDLTSGFTYDLNNVQPLEGGNGNAQFESSITKQFVVLNETVGELAVNIGGRSLEDADNLLDAVAGQLSHHIENLRLSEQNELRSAELEKLVTQLRELDRLKSSFLANMSHELRTPLNSILGFADVMLEELDGPLTENMNNDLGLIQKNGQHLLHLINDVLDMAKIESGKMNLNPETFKIHEIFEDVTSITSTLAGEKNLDLSIEANSDRVLEVFADRTRLRQVMINVVNNALKFTDRGQVSIWAKKHDDRVLISIKDTGMGIPPEKLEAVFQEFTQVDISSTRKSGGTGLGLPISRRLVELHGGRIWAESTGVLGEGCTFYVDLPIQAKIAESIEKQEK